MVRDRSFRRPALWLALLAMMALGAAPTVSRVLAAERGVGLLTTLCTAGGWRVIVLAAHAADDPAHPATGSLGAGHEDCALCLVSVPVLPQPDTGRIPAVPAGAAAVPPHPAPAAWRLSAFALAQPRGPPGVAARGG